ncbi:bifunctional 3-phenylpropionate/cinnamic acid dioxygenase ferredoxin subunit [Citricoccus zhacaiensis]|uniref:Bifunctional 3-phenylpropionate/cinnamic acid dioxygenase ferredoxin subunit n=1 Tax=Citricoccus zhacaiensis TaxID=489142 RepID=A0ABQ2MA68_9MICC|nr:non-heme iron oxygenase ferredoxin subunit [Citricoccus zhacaiensis]GGO48696.1 bifunctional 3-phenylpropionate/cinnamic acid dioxygenase ferredoxin subunit [Citricoccus zhacaiensis]
MSTTASTTAIFACNVGDIEDGESLTLEANGGIAVYRVDGEFFATSDTCTHEKWSLGEEGELEGHEVTCTLHMARFDVRTGAPLCFPATLALKKYATSIDGDKVYVHLIED